MPWCEACAKYLAPSAMNVDGTCPQCGRVVQVASIHGRVTAKNLDLKNLARSDRTYYRRRRERAMALQTSRGCPSDLSLLESDTTVQLGSVVRTSNGL